MTDKKHSDEIDRLTERIEKIESSIKPIIKSYEAKKWLLNRILKYWKLLVCIVVSVFSLVVIQTSPSITIGLVTPTHSERVKS